MLKLPGSIGHQGGIDSLKLWVNVFYPAFTADGIVVKPTLFAQKWNTGGCYLNPEKVKNNHDKHIS